MLFRYTGEIQRNLFHGQGEYVWPNGDRFFGAYENGKRNGIGEMDYADGDSFRQDNQNNNMNYIIFKRELINLEINMNMNHL